MLPKHDSLTFGSISMSGKDIHCPPGIKFNRLAHSDGNQELLLVQLIAETHIIKQFRAVLCGGVKATAAVSDCMTRQARYPDRNGKWPNQLNPTPDGYALHTQKLMYGMAQALFITRKEGFMPVVTEESLWREIGGKNYTTPLLREWVPYIDGKLREARLLRDAWTLNCSCGILTASSKQLDDIVSAGLANNLIRIPS